MVLRPENFALSLDHRVAAHTRGLSYRRLATAPEHLGRRSGHHTALELIHVRQYHLEESRERFRGDLHALMILRAY